MTQTDPTARLLAALAGIDLTSADGRAGLGVVLAELGRRAPDAVLRQAASIELRRLPVRLPPPHTLPPPPRGVEEGSAEPSRRRPSPHRGRREGGVGVDSPTAKEGHGWAPPLTTSTPIPDPSPLQGEGSRASSPHGPT